MMLERIFGSGPDEKVEELKKEIEDKNAKIDELEEEIENLKRKLEKEEERAKRAITEKQGTDKDLKKTKQKLVTLEDKLDRLEEMEEERREYKKVKELARGKAISLFEELGSYRAGDGILVTHYFSEPEESGNRTVEWASRRIESDTGYVALWDRNGLLTGVLVPPFPLDEEFHRGERFRLDSLEKLYESDLKIGLASVHAGRSGVGLLRGDEFENFKVVSSYVKGKHSKGGFSQQRFERIREDQLRKHVGKVRERIDELIENPDYMVLDGNKKVAKRLEKELSVDAPMLVRSLNIEAIGENRMDDLVEQIWSSKLFIL